MQESGILSLLVLCVDGYGVDLMELTHKIVQPFIKALEEALPYKVTITDVHGYIIGSSDPERLNQFHPSAYEIICGRQPIEILEDDTYVNVPEGVVLGYGEKIIYKGKCIGLIGLIGPPEDRKNDIKTAQFILRLLLDREHVQQELDLAMADKNAFVVRLLHGTGSEQERWMAERARLYGIDLEFPRRIVVVRAKLQRFVEQKPMELSKIREEILHIVRGVFANAEDLVYKTETGEIVVLTAVENGKEPEKRKKIIQNRIEKLRQEINVRYEVPVLIGISQEYRKYQDFSIGYRCALTALEIGERTEPEEEIYFYEQMRLSRIVAGFTAEMRRILYHGIIKPLLMASGGRELIRTLQIYFKHNLGVAETAEELFIHRNTLQYRFRRIKQITGYDISIGDEMVQLRLAVLQYQFFHYDG